MITKILKKGPLLAAFFISTVFASEVSITIDDFQVTSADGDQAILNALSKHKVQAALFVSCQYLDRAPIAARLPMWQNAGHLIANHTYSHENYNKKDFEWYKKDILRCHDMIKDKKGFTPLFRFPMLKGGNTTEKRDDMQAFLKSLGYKNGYVTIDTSDWYISERLEAALAKNSKVDLDKYRKYYLEHMWDRAQYYDGLAKKYWKAPVKHTILLHHNHLNSFFLADLISMFKEKGWKIVNASEAFRDPVFDLVPDVLPAGESIMWSLGKMHGDTTLRSPGEDSVYEENRMNELGL